MTTPTVHYIVDYDIPTDNGNRRRAFYREIAKLKEKLHLHGAMSTASVIITPDKQLANKFYEIACRYGRANLYSAILLSSHVGRHRRQAAS